MFNPSNFLGSLHFLLGFGEVFCAFGVGNILYVEWQLMAQTVGVVVDALFEISA